MSKEELIGVFTKDFVDRNFDRILSYMYFKEYSLYQVVLRCDFNKDTLKFFKENKSDLYAVYKDVLGEKLNDMSVLRSFRVDLKDPIVLEILSRLDSVVESLKDNFLSIEKVLLEYRLNSKSDINLYLMDVKNVEKVFNQITKVLKLKANGHLYLLSRERVH